MKRKKHGGKREGAGRPKELLEPTVPIRVPRSLGLWLTKQRISELDEIRKLNLWDYCTEIMQRAKEGLDEN